MEEGGGGQVRISKGEWLLSVHLWSGICSTSGRSLPTVVLMWPGASPTNLPLFFFLVEFCLQTEKVFLLVTSLRPVRRLDKVRCRDPNGIRSSKPPVQEMSRDAPLDFEKRGCLQFAQ